MLTLVLYSERNAGSQYGNPAVVLHSISYFFSFSVLFLSGRSISLVSKSKKYTIQPLRLDCFQYALNEDINSMGNSFSYFNILAPIHLLIPYNELPIYPAPAAPASPLRTFCLKTR